MANIFRICHGRDALHGILVYEGHVLRRGIITSPLGGNFVQNRMGEYLVSEKGMYFYLELRVPQIIEIIRIIVFKQL